MPVLSKFAEPKGPHSHLSFFDFSLSSYNLNGLSAYHCNTPARLARHNRILDNIRTLATTSHIIFLQETHLNHLDHISLNNIVVGWKVFYSNKSSRSGRVAILISPLVHIHYNISFPPIDAAVQGHALPLLLTHKEEGEPDILLHNLYLPTGKSHSERLADVLDALSTITPARHNLAGGDINFVTAAADTSAAHPHVLSERA